ncbi:hypothetical protein AN958_10758 [Leucoagaricus sp. SymC.cos]|nr:hypothetical protein AN958_10758 [Leucoagaricus sp. SymC.cos]
MNPLANNQQQPFSDANSSQSQPPHMPNAGFPNMGPMSNQNPGLNAASISQRNPGILGMQNGPMGRQLELMLAQQPQNGGLFNAVKLNQQNPQLQQVQQQQRDQQQSQQQLQPPAINHPNPADIFASPAMSSEALRRPSPSHPPNLPSQIQGPMQGPQQHPVPGVHHPGAQGMPLRRNQLPMNIQDITERLKATRQAIVHNESELRQLMNQMHVAPSSAELTQKVRSLQIDLKTKQEVMARLLQQQQIALQNGAMTNGMPRVGGPNGGQPWAPQNAQPFDSNGNIRQPQNNQQNMPQQMHPQGPNGMQPNPSANSHLMPPGGVPRPGPTPNPQGIQPPQQLGSPFPGQMNVPANMANKPPFPIPGFNAMGAGPGAANAMQQRLGGVGYPPPLDKNKLELMLPGFLQKKGIKIDPTMLTWNDQQIDLSHLHTLVMSDGGFQKVQESDSWNIIGGKMGFVNFPGSDREPPKSGPGVAQHLAHVYREYLLDLEQVYVRTWLQSNSGMRMAGANPGGQLQRMTPALLPYAALNANELRQRNIPEHIIAMVEQHRTQLLRTATETRRFQQQVRLNVGNAPAGGPGNVGAGGPGGPSGVPGMSGAGGPAAAAAAMAMRQRMMGTAAVTGGMGGLNPLVLRNPETLKNAMETANRLKEEFKKGPHAARLLQISADVPFEHQAEFNSVLQNLGRQTGDLSEKMHLVYLLLPQVTQRAITICGVIMAQRQLCATGQPRYILTLDQLRSMQTEVHKIIEAFSIQQQAITNKNQWRGAPGPQTTQPSQQTHPSQPHPSQIPGQPPHQPPGMTGPINLQNPPSKRKPQNAPTPSNTAPSPATVAAAVSTPAPTNAPTPTAAVASPSAPKSPKGKAPAKAKQGVKRKMSTAPSAAVAPPASAPAAGTPSSSVHNAPTPAGQPQTQSSESGMTPQGSTSVNGSMKRAREEENVPSGRNVAPSPLGGAIADQPSPPKRVKIEWDGPPSEELQQRKAMIDGVKTEEDANNFLATMSEIFKIAKLTELTNMLLKGYTQMPGTSSAADGLDAFVTPLDPPLLPAMEKDLEKYFDFSSLGGEDDDSKTPELVSSSSTTNTSPGSNSGNETTEGGGGMTTNELKNEDTMDLTYLGMWKEVDGGESASYQNNEWKWDSTMPSLEHPWAIFTS